MLEYYFEFRPMVQMLFKGISYLQLWHPICLAEQSHLCSFGRGHHVLLNLLNELGKRDQIRGLPSILSLFRNKFNKFNNTRARVLDSIYHMTNTLKSHFWRKNVILLSLCTQSCYGRHNVSRKSIKH